jgi:hypothetical protein
MPNEKPKKGFEFAPDTYLQNELEASFIYEDTPDQVKATSDVKADMEKPIPWIGLFVVMWVLVKQKLPSGLRLKLLRTANRWQYWCLQPFLHYSIFIHFPKD